MNIEQSSKEQKLKALIEDMGVGARHKAFKADMTLKLHKDFVDITYDQAIELVKENNDILKHMPVLDPAYDFMVKQRNDMLKWADAINCSEIMGRHDHELPVHALVSVNGVTVEVNFYIPQLYYFKPHRNKIIEDTLRGIISQSSDWAGGLRHPAEIEFVEL